MGVRCAGNTELAEIALMCVLAAHDFPDCSNRVCASGDVRPPPVACLPARPPRGVSRDESRGHTRDIGKSWLPLIRSIFERATHHLDEIRLIRYHQNWGAVHVQLGDFSAPCRSSIR